MDPVTTCQVLASAGRYLTGVAPTVAMDSRVGNVNGRVDALIESGRLTRILAQVEVSYSNSMIEAWWRSLKHSWLYLHSLDSASAVEKLVASYVEQHNSLMPHRAFAGQTPDEAYFGTAPDLERDLADRRRHAAAERVRMNRAQPCEDCLAREAPPDPLPTAPA